jgi:hypothetical protein
VICHCKFSMAADGALEAHPAMGFGDIMLGVV